jgi:hypothetical protein
MQLVEDPDSDEHLLKGERENGWIVLAAFLNMIADVCHAFHEFFTMMSMTANSRYLWKTGQQRFYEQASRDIESITGDVNAATNTTGPGQRTWPPEP